MVIMLYFDLSVHMKGYKLTKQGKNIFKMGWRQITSETQGGKMLSTMTMETDSAAQPVTETPTILQDQLLFGREVKSSFQFTLVAIFVRYHTANLVSLRGLMALNVDSI